MLSQCAIQRGFNYRLNISRRDREGDFDGHYNRYCVLRTNNNSNAIEREAGRSAFEVRVLLMYCVIRCIARLGTVEIRFRANFGHCAIFTGAGCTGLNPRSTPGIVLLSLSGITNSRVDADVVKVIARSMR